MLAVPHTKLKATADLYPFRRGLADVSWSTNVRNASPSAAASETNQLLSWSQSKSRRKKMAGGHERDG